MSELKLPHVPVVDYDEQLTESGLLLISGSFSHAAHQEPNVIHISSLGGCLYHDAYKASVLERSPMEPEASMPAFLGNAFENAVVDAIRQEYWPGLTLVEPPAENDDRQHHVNGAAYGLPGMKGHLDGLALLEAEPTLLEFKLMSPWRFRDFTRGRLVKGKATTEPGFAGEFHEYRIQIHTYMGLQGIKQCLFIVGCSYLVPVREYMNTPLLALLVPFDERMFDEAIDRAERLQDCLDSGTPPACENRRYCNYGEENA